MSEPQINQDPFGLSGTTIEGKYRIVKVIGDGGFGVVYRGEHTGFGESIAIKCLKLPAELSDKSRTQFLEQLREEGRLLHRLSRVTSGIVQALDVGAFVTPNGMWVPYLVLEWLEGETLGELLKGRSQRPDAGMDVYEAVALLEPAARALAVAHGQKIAHRDVKPANLFVTNVGGKRTVKVLDFGIAKVLTEHASFTEALAATRQAPTAFTPRYGAPEQFNKQRGATGPWTDVFALALVFVELVSGRKALEGDDPTELYIMAADPTMRPTARSRGANVPDPIERVLEKALSVEPKHRYSDCGAFWDALVASVAESRGQTASVAATPISASSSNASNASADSLLTTAEFAEKKNLGVATESAGKISIGSGPGALDRTEEVPTRIDPKRAGGGTVPMREADPMAETPLGARVQKPVSSKKPAPSAELKNTLKAGGSTGPAIAEKSSELDSTASPASVETKGAPIWPWLLGALLIGGGALGYTLYTMGSPQDKLPTKPTATASSSGKTKAGPSSEVVVPVASVSASASVSAAASASAAPFLAPRDMMLIPPVETKLGEGADARDVKMTKAFYMDAMEVTVAQYRQCTTCPVSRAIVLPPESVSLIPQDEDSDAGAGPGDVAAYISAWTSKCNDLRDAMDHPMNCVTFAAAEAYCVFRGRRLPTEAEWELTARGGAAGRPFPWGDDKPTCARSCYDRNGLCMEPGEGVMTCPTGGRPRDRTAGGLFDFGGNVAEWVADGFTSPAPGGTDPKGPAGAARRVIRGGSFLDPAFHVRSTFRMGVVPTTAHVSIGFRCALDAPPPELPAAPTP